jgi:predicted component of type VI protein secretion system
MYESQTWRVRPGEPFTFGRAPACSVVLPVADRGVSRSAGSFRFRDGCWWLHNDSSSSVLCVLGDRGFRADLPPGLQVPLQQWHAKVTVTGALGRYILRLRLPILTMCPTRNRLRSPM